MSRGLLLTAFLVLQCSAGWACQVSEPLNFLTFGKTNIIQRARIVGFRSETFASKTGIAVVLGIIEFEARPNAGKNSKSGEKATALFSWSLDGRFEAYWTGPSVALPKRWSVNTDVIVGLDVGVLPDGRPGIFIAGDQCDPPAMVADTNENIKLINFARGAMMRFSDRCRFVQGPAGPEGDLNGCP